MLLTLPASDTNDDKVLDEQELEALFTKEVRNVEKNPAAPVMSESEHVLIQHL